MSKSYLLPCSCGHNLTIDIGQAGQTITCDECTKDVEVPTMRGIRQLEPADDYVPEYKGRKPPSVESGNPQSVVFSIGLFIAVLGLAVAAVVGYKRSQLVELATPPTPPDNSKLDQLIDSWNVFEVYDFWSQVEEEPLDWEKPIHVMAGEELPVWTSLLTAALAVALVGIGIAAYGAINKPKPPA